MSICEQVDLPDPLSPERASELTTALKALSDPARLRMVAMIAADPRGEACVCDFTGSIDLAQPTVSHHLKVLFEAGLLTRRKEGTWVFYRVVPTKLDEVAQALGSFSKGPAPEVHESAHLELPSAGTVEHVLARGVDELTYRFTGTFARETVDRYVHESFQTLFRTARIKTFVPVLAVRFAQERLTALAQSQGHIAKTVPEVLFVCTHNAGRSQMAAALLTAMAPGRVHVRSAGSLPASEINPAVIESLAEIGLELGQAFPKPLTDDVVRAADVVVTMGCGDSCPIYPGKRYLDWELPDPAGQSPDDVRPIRDQISAKLQGLLVELGIPTT
ncbi:metalloregulator ArsR/SmtB family transcription factor [Tessaracoccus sp. MC1627]|uniref:metalloregulator ArsR/SmtB family transcription factor n=1 Tax=Tessaracoccus sp. MC1627 TaxID=2760312 RepID=UPI001603C6C8|nr:metalloregulator ArsR/SmtB family transcription factor [Tessaracoccus sp. MC1627]MBB1513634.1 metalloregulator ArsR/SmtB family transcription factor [Tessaracoccus sp. MC1627]